MKINYFFRRPSPVFHSIEEQFFAIQKELPKNVIHRNVFARYHSKGLFRRILISIQAAFNQNEINHITGDINFISTFLKKKKTILTIHDIGSALNRNSIKKAILRFFWFTIPFKRVKYITAISEFSKNEILQSFKINPDKIVVIPDCISDEFKFVPKSFNADKPVILQIGTKQNKNLTRLIEAIKEINCKLIIVGKLTENQVSSLKNNKIDFENKFNLSFSEIIDLYKNCDIVSFVSTYEGFGVPILEAQATGRAIITSNLPPLNDVAGNNGALLINPFDVEEISKSIKELIFNSELRESLIKSGLENVKKYSAKSIAEQYYNLYLKINC